MGILTDKFNTFRNRENIRYEALKALAPEVGELVSSITKELPFFKVKTSQRSSDGEDAYTFRIRPKGFMLSKPGIYVTVSSEPNRETPHLTITLGAGTSYMKKDFAEALINTPEFKGALDIKKWEGNSKSGFETNGKIRHPKTGLLVETYITIDYDKRGGTKGLAKELPLILCSMASVAGIFQKDQKKLPDISNSPS